MTKRLLFLIPDDPSASSFKQSIISSLSFLKDPNIIVNIPICENLELVSIPNSKDCIIFINHKSSLKDIGKVIDSYSITHAIALISPISDSTSFNSSSDQLNSNSSLSKFEYDDNLFLMLDQKRIPSLIIEMNNQYIQQIVDFVLCEEYEFAADQNSESDSDHEEKEQEIYSNMHDELLKMLSDLK